MKITHIEITIINIQIILNRVNRDWKNQYWKIFETYFQYTGIGVIKNPLRCVIS